MDPVTRVKVYVELLDEGTPTWRPTEAIQLSNGLYQLLPVPNYDPKDEKWKFSPSSIVRVEKRQGRAGEYLVAVAPP
jgi:hypothetical protein